MVEYLAREIGTILRSVIPQDKASVPLHEPEFDTLEQDYVLDCLSSGMVSSVGQYVNRFEDELRRWTGTKHVIAVSNGTSALHLCLHALGIGYGDEVLVPALSFVATANAVCHTGAVPHFVDCEKQSLGIDPWKLRDYLQVATEPYHDNKKGTVYFCNRKTKRPIKAIIPMHCFGMPSMMDELNKVAQDYNLLMIEDAAESLGSCYKDKPTGSLGKIAAFSFNGNKIITTGGGGAISTNDPDLAKHCKHLSTTAKLPHPFLYDHNEVGFNYRMPNLNAALGCAQLTHLPKFLEQKRRLAANYIQKFMQLKNVRVFTETSDCQSNYWLNALLIDELVDLDMRDALLTHLNTNGLSCRPVWNLLPKLAHFQNNPCMDISCAQEVECKIINIPSSAYLSSNVKS